MITLFIFSDFRVKIYIFVNFVDFSNYSSCFSNLLSAPNFALSDCWIVKRKRKVRKVRKILKAKIGVPDPCIQLHYGGVHHPDFSEPADYSDRGCTAPTRRGRGSSNIDRVKAFFRKWEDLRLRRLD